MTGASRPWAITGRTAEQIARSVESAVDNGRLPAGAPVPAVRALAVQLEVSPATVAAGYQILKQRGVLVGEPGRGTFVADRPPLGLRIVDTSTRDLRDLSDGNPDPELLPDLRAMLPRLPERTVLYEQPSISDGLLAAAVQHFADLDVDETNLCLTAGAMDGIERVLTSRVRPHDIVVVEDPSYTGVLDLARSLGLRLVGAEMDEYGVLPDAFDRALARGATACIVTPRAQNPTGAAFDARRATALRRVLTRHPNVLVVENDHTGAVAGVDYHSLTPRRAEWAVVRSLSKSLGPDLRLALVAADRRTRSRVEGRFQAGPAWISHILQDLAAVALTDVTTQRRLVRAAATYARRRDGLVAALQHRGIPATGRSGLNVYVPVSRSARGTSPVQSPGLARSPGPVRSEAQVLEALAERGWAVRAGETHRLDSEPFVRVTAATLTAAETRRFAEDLAEVLDAADHGRSAGRAV